MWGQVFYQNYHIIPLRIIPTRVGTSCSVRLSATIPRDHPHACGDKSSQAVKSISSEGSSPRVWGQDCTLYTVLKCTRIIPTRVGTSGQVVCACVGMRDHPHACGDKGNEFLFIKSRLGSSPRVWGQVFYQNYHIIPLRIIPTRVGTSCSVRLSATIPRDHPHACGDKRSSRLCVCRYAGSSPRVWGQGQ